MKKIKVLYVDDEIINLELFELNLEDKYTVLTSDNGLKGLELIDSNPDIKVVISDMKMPIMNGLEFISKAKEKHPDIKYYIISGYDMTEEIQTALKQGLIYSYLKKPFNLEKIYLEIEQAT